MKEYISLLVAVLVILPAGILYANFQEDRFSAQIDAFSCFDSRDKKNVPAITGHSLNTDFVDCAASSYHPLNKYRRDLFRRTIDFLLDFF